MGGSDLVYSSVHNKWMNSVVVSFIDDSGINYVSTLLLINYVATNARLSE